MVQLKLATTFSHITVDELHCYDPNYEMVTNITNICGSETNQYLDIDIRFIYIVSFLCVIRCLLVYLLVAVVWYRRLDTANDICEMWTVTLNK